MKIGDLIKVVGPLRVPKNNKIKPFVSVVLEVNKSKNHPNGLGLVKVLENGQEQWYPIGYIEVINE